MDHVSVVCRRRQFSRRTEEAYRFWIRRFILFHKKHHPREIGAPGAVEFINDLAVKQRVAASTQIQALNALVFLYRDVLELELGPLVGLQRVQRKARVPVVLSVAEVRAVLQCMHGTSRLMAAMLYGSGLRLGECSHLRVNDIDFANGLVLVRHGKGGKDRNVPLAQRMVPALNRQVNAVLQLHARERQADRGYAPMPGALHRKYPKA